MPIIYDEALNLLMWFCGLLLRLKISEYCHQEGVRFGWHAKDSSEQEQRPLWSNIQAVQKLLKNY